MSDGLTRSVHRDVQPAARLFVSRRDTLGNRACRNAREVEAVFVGHGFTVIYPEAGPRPAGAPVPGRARRRWVRGLRPLQRLQQHEPRAPRGAEPRVVHRPNEHLFAAVLGCAEHYFGALPTSPTGDGWSEKAYYSGWEFDLERNLDDMEGLLRSL